MEQTCKRVLIVERADIMADNLTEADLRENIAGQTIIFLPFCRFITSYARILSSLTAYKTTFNVFLILT